jgi:hypothetical protein
MTDPHILVARERHGFFFSPLHREKSVPVFETA